MVARVCAGVWLSVSVVGTCTYKNSTGRHDGYSEHHKPVVQYNTVLLMCPQNKKSPITRKHHHHPQPHPHPITVPSFLSSLSALCALSLSLSRHGPLIPSHPIPSPVTTTTTTTHPSRPPHHRPSNNPPPTTNPPPHSALQIAISRSRSFPIASASAATHPCVPCPLPLSSREKKSPRRRNYKCKQEERPRTGILKGDSLPPTIHPHPTNTDPV